MDCSYVVLIGCLVALSAGALTVQPKVCSNDDGCKCLTMDGQQIDLSPLADIGQMNVTDANGANTFVYNPCKPFGCNGKQQLMCQKTLPNDLGLGNTPKFIKVGTSYALQYTNGERSAMVILDCTKDETPNLVIRKAGPGDNEFQLKSKYACLETAPNTTPKTTSKTTPKKTTPKKTTPKKTTPKKTTPKKTTPKKTTPKKTTPKKTTPKTTPKKTTPRKTTPKKTTPKKTTPKKPTPKSTPKTPRTTPKHNGAMTTISTFSAGVLAVITMTVRQIL